jgi:chromosomal replication initiator protein
MTPNDPQSLWLACLARLEHHVPLDEINTWIRPLRVAECDEQSFVLDAPNDFVRDQVISDYLPMIQDFLGQYGFEADKVRIRVGEKAAPQAQPRAGGSKRGDSASLDERYHFETFVLGKSNELAFAAAKQVAQNPGTVYNPLL